MFSRCFLDRSVVERTFVIGLSQISFFFLIKQHNNPLDNISSLVRACLTYFWLALVWFGFVDVFVKFCFFRLHKLLFAKNAQNHYLYACNFVVGLLRLWARLSGLKFFACRKTSVCIRQTIKKKLKRQCWVALWFRHWNLNKIVIIAIILLTMRCSDVAWLSSSESFHGG